MRKSVSLGVLVGAIVACGSDVAEEAGDMMRGAGEAIADAGAALADAAAGDAQAETDAGVVGSKARVVEQACDIVRTETAVPTSGQTGQGEERFASIAADVTELRSVWLCRESPISLLGCSPGYTCTGAVVPKMRCMMVTPYVGEDDALWVSCRGGWTQARFVFES